MVGFPNLQIVEPPKGPATWASSARWDPTSIPRRPWIAPGYIMRGVITVVVGTGGVSKSTLMLGWAVALALENENHRLKPDGRFRVIYFNAEDDDDEQTRRLTAV